MQLTHKLAGVFNISIQVEHVDPLVQVEQTGKQFRHSSKLKYLPLIQLTQSGGALSISKQVSQLVLLLHLSQSSLQSWHS